MPRFVSFYSTFQINPGKLCLPCIQSGLCEDEMHLPPSKTDGAVEIAGETMISKLGVKVCMMETPLYKTSFALFTIQEIETLGDLTWPTEAKKTGCGSPSLSLLLPKPDLSLDVP